MTATAESFATMDDYDWEIIEEPTYPNWREACVDEEPLIYEDCLDKSLIAYEQALITNKH
ncbi:hypothetical protein AAJP47_12565 [Psychrobacter sp. B38]|uniref:hypothetical protein n=1 Tax=Psychrobacter sp. B38 TaxID=3143538 RepID=UPI003210DD89